MPQSPTDPPSRDTPGSAVVGRSTLQPTAAPTRRPAGRAARPALRRWRTARRLMRVCQDRVPRWTPDVMKEGTVNDTQTATLETDEANAPLSALDRCDSCGAQAYVRAT